MPRGHKWINIGENCVSSAQKDDLFYESCWRASVFEMKEGSLHLREFKNGPRGKSHIPTRRNGNGVYRSLSEAYQRCKGIEYTHLTNYESKIDSETNSGIPRPQRPYHIHQVASSKVNGKYKYLYVLKQAEFLGFLEVLEVFLSCFWHALLLAAGVYEDITWNGTPLHVTQQTLLHNLRPWA